VVEKKALWVAIQSLGKKATALEGKTWGGVTGKIKIQQNHSPAQGWSRQTKGSFERTTNYVRGRGLRGCVWGTDRNGHHQGGCGGGDSF